MHDLSHAYAAELAAAKPDESADALGRLRSWYLHSVRNAIGTRATSWIAYAVADPARGTSPARFDSPERATDWLLAHRRCLRSLLVDAAQSGDNDAVARLTPSLARFLKQIGATREAVELLTLAAECARLEGDRLVEAVCRHQLGHFLSHLGDEGAALSAYEEARALFAQLEHADGVLGSEIAIGATYATLGRVDEAIETLTEATREDRGANKRVLATGLNNLATGYLESGRIQEAKDAALRAVAAASDDEDNLKEDLAACYITLGEAQSADSRWSEAIETLGEAVRLCTAYGNLALQVVTLQLRGAAARELGDIDAARTDWTTALDLLDELGQDSVPVVLTPASGQRDDLRRLLAGLDAPAGDALT
ncbi:tetratricopeptide repeat protein [Solicola gregarius]|uniref:Tetratricopeptide repeat protein n=1 Tax=Solicola gregarius TaxID=2908642 RepID=A0AA46YJN0_9ACTN|nr:tetratricopeptide repeat protein [Solicola gregarius]UYM04512.1 tetratricopeptide repeat protein [Solicola gregarius]